MISSKDDWSTRAQVFRNIHLDFTALGIDFYLGTAYVLISAAIDIISPSKDFYGTYLVLTIVVGYMTVRICQPEAATESRQFYSNLPRNRDTAYWTHTGFMLGYCAIMSAVIIAVMSLPGNRSVHFNASLAAQPYLVICFLAWVMYSQSHDLLKVFVAFGAIVLANLSAQTGSNSPTIAWLGAFMQIGVGAGLIYFAQKRWLNVQIGELK